MFKRAMSEIDVKAGIKNILERIENACTKRIPELQYGTPTLVAVSKTKPVDMIIDAYDVGQRHFGENYVQELCDKSVDPRIVEHCTDIKWHYIGHLQRNKINKLLTAPGLYMVETVDSEKLAVALNNACAKFLPENSKLNIMLQINTSGEEEKNGMNPNQVVEVMKNVKEKCPNLNINGLMTIGMFGYDCSKGPNPDFLCLRKCRDEVCDALKIDHKHCNLSMGMSDDFEHAIELGSTVVRVGSSIFGYRKKKNEVLN